MVLYQVGTFFEIYGIKNETTGDVLYSQIVEVCGICQLNMSFKSSYYGDYGQILMAGFRDYTVDKYIAKLTEAGYTVPVFIQTKEEGGKPVRTLESVYSSGTYISYDISPSSSSSSVTSNNMICIWIELHRPLQRSLGFPSHQKHHSRMRETIVYGISVIDTATGKTAMFQYETAFSMNITTFDELERIVSVYNPCEILFLSPFEEKDRNAVLQMTNLLQYRRSVIHTYDNRREDNPIITRCSTQLYLRDTVGRFFGAEAYDVCEEFQQNNMASQSLVFLLHFIEEHNPDIVRRISPPTFTNASYRVLLANHTLSQLNIIGGGGGGETRLSSVLSFLNRCITPMGKRKFQYQLTNPTYNEEWLEGEYAMIEYIVENPSHYTKVEEYRKKMGIIRDMEKIYRQIVAKRIYPASLYHLYHSIRMMREVQRDRRATMASSSMTAYLERDFIMEAGLDLDLVVEGREKDYIETISSHLLQLLDDHLEIEVCKSLTSTTTFEENIIKRGVSPELDEVVDKYKEGEEMFYGIRAYLNTLIVSYENPKNKEKEKDEIDYVKIHETEKSGVSLQITQKRSQILKSIFETMKQKNQTTLPISPRHQIPIADITFTKASSTSVVIECRQIKDITTHLHHYKELINERIGAMYRKIVEKLEGEGIPLENLCKYVASLDVLLNKAYIAREYNYCRPTIGSPSSSSSKDKKEKETKEKAFVEATDLRHVLIEHIQQNEIYVANDIRLGVEKDGVLLYGTNAVGKTSFIRALGIAVIMAQAGLYVPCSRFHYRPYTALFSRILGNDNLFKGLSTFSVEMSELRSILNRGDENSLVLGDELCSGTEMESALSIFVAGLMNLHTKGASFIFATHFHEIVDMEEVRNMGRLCMKHMEVRYDRALDTLVYDRTLKEGSGPRIYGLEVCKSLYLEEEFLETAHQIRNKYFPETRGGLSHATSSYNSSKIRGVCENCGVSMGEEVHHLQPQRWSDENGYIGTFHKNHRANLMNVCNTCHLTIHHNDDKKDDKEEKEKKQRKKTIKGEYRII